MPTVKVLIPVEISGYTGQRDQWESFTNDHEVALTDDERIELKDTRTGGRNVTFDLGDLKKAVEILEGQDQEPKAVQPIDRGWDHS